MVAVNDGTIKRIGHNRSSATTWSSGHLRQPLHLRAARPRLEGLPGAEGAQALFLRLRARHPEKGQGPPPSPLPAATRRRARPARARVTRRNSPAALRPAERPHNVDRADLSGQLDELLSKKFPGYESFKSYFGGVLHFNRGSMELGRCARARRSSPAPCWAGSARPGQARASRQLRHQARRARRPADRSEADPGRLEAARGDGDLPRRRRGPVRVLDREHLPDPADVQGAATAPRAGGPAHLDLRLWPQDIHTGQIDRRILAAMEYLADYGFRPTVTSLKCGHSAYTPPGQHLRAFLRRRDRHRPGQRDPDHRQPGPRVDHRSDDPALLKLQGTMEPPRSSR